MRRPTQHPVTRSLREAVPAIMASLAQVRGSLLDRQTQQEIDRRLAGFPAWTDWVARVRRPLATEPWTIGPGLPITPGLLVGAARALFPGFEISPYDIGPVAVSEVMAQVGSSARSHSQNDIPAPAHTAGFFDPDPPLIAVFACVRPHPTGGAETTVVDLDRVLRRLSEEQRSELADRELVLTTPRRLHSRRRRFRVLDHIDGLPFIRFRMDYTVARTAALAALETLIADRENQFVAPLVAGEILFVWNGAPHGRMPQVGPTPIHSSARRKLLRCRLRPAARQSCRDLCPNVPFVGTALSWR